MFLCVVAVGVASLAGARGQQVLVTVPSQSMAQMQALTRSVDEFASEASARANSSRVLLGAIEATMSRVVDAESLSVVTTPVSVPTMSLLDRVSFDAERRVWTMRYRTTRMDPAQELNRFQRILYLSKKGNMARGDPGNPCLAEGVGPACLAAFAARYHSAPVGPGAAAEDDRLVWAPGTSALVTATVEPVADSLVQTVVLEIPHDAMRGELAAEHTHHSELWGDQKRYVFGIGMLFLAKEAGRHVVISDVFSVVESSAQKLAISALDAYSVATFAEFYSMVVTAKQFHIVSITYVVPVGQPGETFQGVDVAMRPRGGAEWTKVGSAECAAAQTVLDGGLTECLGTTQMCAPQVVPAGEGADAAEWIRVVYPVPAGMQAPLDVNTLLRTTSAAGRSILSTVNFQTLSQSEEACKDAVVSTYDATEYVRVELYRGSAVTAEAVDARAGIQVKSANQTVLLQPTAGMVESMLTVVMRPVPGRSDYFDTHPEQMRMDQVYMSHALVGVPVPASVDNAVVTDSASGGRASLRIDPGLLGLCPLLPDNQMSDLAQQCVTTHDWSLQALPRGNGATATTFVREVTAGDDAAHLQWLQDNILGASALAESSAASVLARSRALLETHGRVYWMLPLFYWPRQRPIGLADTTILSLAWSVAGAAEPAPAAPARRLLWRPNNTTLVKLEDPYEADRAAVDELITQPEPATQAVAGPATGGRRLFEIPLHTTVVEQTTHAAPATSPPPTPRPTPPPTPRPTPPPQLTPPPRPTVRKLLPPQHQKLPLPTPEPKPEPISVPKPKPQPEPATQAHRPVFRRRPAKDMGKGGSRDI